MISSHQTLLRSLKFGQIIEESTLYGLLIAVLIIGVWTISLVLLLSLPIDQMPAVVIPGLMLWQMFLYTGLFITAHDAMHGAVFPHAPRLNHFIGATALQLYGLFKYRELLKKHWLHHRHPATALDPDFHDGNHPHLFDWYRQFMINYWSWSRMIWLTGIVGMALVVLHISPFNLVLFWAAPSILSSLQLFYFGTFLTHREPQDGYQNQHRAQTNPLPVFWSFITCYHFGYHEEHHEFPHVPWWRLPAVHQQRSPEAQAR